MIKTLLGAHNFYKANLHAHTDVSDGVMTPEELKCAYLNEGYSVVAFTDHEVFVPHNDLTDDKFLAVNGYEISLNEKCDKSFPFIRACHLNAYAEDENAVVPPYFNIDSVWLKKSLGFVNADTAKIKSDNSYTVENINKIIETANKSGFFVCYNHPVWSLANPSDYMGVKNLWGIEVFNTGCDNCGLTDGDLPYGYLLNNGENLYPVCSDDTHKFADVGGGFTMIDAENLTYNSVIKSLKNGNFYSSEGPLIEKMFVDDGFLILKTTPCVKAVMLTNRRLSEVVTGESVTEIKFPLAAFFEGNKENEGGRNFVRVTLTDKSGKKAYTRAYSESEL